MSNFSTWDRVVLETFANEVYEEWKATKADLRTAIDAYREILKETDVTKNMQQLSIKQIQPNGAKHSDGEWNQIPLDLPHL